MGIDCNGSELTDPRKTCPDDPSLSLPMMPGEREGGRERGREGARGRESERSSLGSSDMW